MGSQIENVDQSDYWNGSAGTRWSEAQAILDVALEPFARALVERAAPRSGERAIDIGCGCGASTLLVGAAVGASGAALGLDLSSTMLQVAAARARDLPQISFEVADAAVFSPPAPADLLVSRFGVMFFNDPVRAFSHLRTMLKPGGRIVFVCWRSARENPWMTVPAEAIAPLLPPAPPADPDAPGPFALAQRARISSIMETAGFTDLVITPHDAPVAVAEPPGGVPAAVRFATTVGPVARALEQGDDRLRGQVIETLASALAPHVVAGGLQLPGAVWLVSARTPGA